ncbi:MAG: tetratricopeptide repeat protein [Phaeodactylibacter sp.]|nr:tetratricopeptide repeat protein [Phaeodactylibacter sp.]MCB9300123.1 tetratricopeptide repeat protein [Lewinellaceae bacterium]
MTKLQWAVIASAVVLFLTLYFTCDTKPRDIQALEKSRALAGESTDVTALLTEAKASLSPAQSSPVLALEAQLDKALEDSSRVEVLKQLSGQWYQLGVPALAGYYAQQVAEANGTEEAWSIAGTTYTICIQNSQEPKVRDFCTGRAVQAFENAISINPANLAHQVNLALAYTANPPQDNPMKGILMLRSLNQSNPDNVLILNTLARLALKTGQFSRAVERLEHALSIEPDNTDSICLLAQAYEGAGETAKAAEFTEKCRSQSGR